MIRIRIRIRNRNRTRVRIRIRAKDRTMKKIRNRTRYLNGSHILMFFFTFDKLNVTK